MSNKYKPLNLHTALMAITAAFSPVMLLAAQIDITTFNTLRVGMTEGEILARAGYPDLDTSTGAVQTVRQSTSINDYDEDEYAQTNYRKTVQFTKELHYIPDSSEHDPHLTIISIRGGLVTAIDRTKLFSRASLPAKPVSSSKQYLSDHELKILRADKTLRAAEQYAATRAKLKAHSVPEEDLGESAVYTAKQADGSTYYGDRPPP